MRTAWPVLLAVAVGTTALGAQAAPQASAPMYANLQGDTLLDNERVLVRKFSLPPGQSTGTHNYASDELLVFVKGGVLQSNSTGRRVLWKDGRVAFHAASAQSDAGSTNAGREPIEMIAVTLKPFAGATPAAATPKYRHLDYPNIPGEDLFENDLVIVQRFLVLPGQWEGVHAHHPDMLYIHIKGGRWAARSKNQPPHPYPDASPDGSVGWMPTIDLSEEHQSGNVGPNPIDLIWVTLKK